MHLWYFWYFWPFAQVTREKRDPRLQLASGGAAQLAEQVAEARCAHYLEASSRRGSASKDMLSSSIHSLRCLLL